MNQTAGLAMLARVETLWLTSRMTSLYIIGDPYFV